MKSIKIVLLVVLSWTVGQSQNKPLLVFDLENETVDSLVNIEYDTTLESSNTNYFVGSFDSNYNLLDEEIPIENIQPNSMFSLKKRAEIDYDLNNFPVRTSVKFFFEENDILNGYCSGSMISSKHVLTAAHCIVDFDSNNLSFDSIYICPVYNNGFFNSNFNCSYVKKVYFFKNWEAPKEDIAILELEEPIGERTGWLGIGFEQNEEELEEAIFYKFSYPGKTIIQIDPNEYNGDTLYYSYGKMDLFNEHTLGISNTNAIPGESGSSIIKIKNEEEYITYGTLSFSNNLIHSRIKNSIYFPFVEIIKDDLLSNTEDVDDTNEFELKIYPNPTKGHINIERIANQEPMELSIYDTFGKSIIRKVTKAATIEIDLEDKPNGIYLLKVSTGNKIGIKKIIKSGN